VDARERPLPTRWASGPRFHYEAPVFNFECELAYDDSGLLLDYPGIAVRAA
jgi:hypothetical protein